MKDFTRMSPLSRPRSVLALALLAALPLVAAGCADNRVQQLAAEEGDSAAVASDGEQAVAAEDTATRTAGESLSSPQGNPEDTLAAPAGPRKYNAGEDPDYARRMGWPVKGPTPLAGALLPNKRIVCYYGHPKSTRMGALGEFPKAEMLGRLKRQIAEWEQADPSTPVKPCLHMVSVVAQGEPGTTGKYRTITGDTVVERVYSWAKEIDGIFIVDIQVGTDDIRNILPRFDWILKNPDVHLAVDPEFYMRNGQRPGSKIGTMSAADINYVTEHLAKLVREHNIPPKTLVIHRFTRPMVTNYKQIKLRPEVQVVMHMDGWGAPWLKRDSYRDYVVQEPVQFTGFKLFYHNDTKKGDPLMKPSDLLKLEPKPVYIQYQ